MVEGGILEDTEKTGWEIAGGGAQSKIAIFTDPTVLPEIQPKARRAILKIRRPDMGALGRSVPPLLV